MTKHYAESRTILHILFVEGGYPHPHGGGGAGTYVQLIGRELVKRGHMVSVIASQCSNCPETSVDQGVKVYRPRLHANLHWYLSKIPYLRTFSLAFRTLEVSAYLDATIQAINKEYPIDLVEFTEGGSFWHSWKSRIPYLSHLHGSRFTTLKMMGKPVNHSDWYERKVSLSAIQRANWVVSPSQAMLDIVQQEAGRRFKHTSVFPYPLDPALLNQEDVQLKSPACTSKIVFFAARNDPVKGADTLLAAIPLVTAGQPQVKFHFYGYQPGTKEILPDNVEIFPFLPKEELLERMKLADLCVIPSRWDNSPNTVYEAMAAGKSVVASNVGGIPELVIHDKTGFLVEPGDIQALSKAILSLIKNPLLQKKMGEMGRDRIRNLANLSTNIDQRLELYQQVITG